MALSFAYEKGLHCTIARIFNTIGVNQSGAYGMVVPTFIKQALKMSLLQSMEMESKRDLLAMYAIQSML